MIILMLFYSIGILILADVNRLLLVPTLIVFLYGSCRFFKEVKSKR